MNLIPRNQHNDIDSLFDNVFPGFPSLIGKAMRVNINEDDHGYEITAELPGFSKEDISVTFRNDTLTITASRETDTSKKKKGKLIRRERSSGTFTRSFTVHEGVKQEDIEASFTEGLLILIIPKRGQHDAETDVLNISIE